MPKEKMMNRKLYPAVALLAIFATTGLIRYPSLAKTQVDETVGWLEGTVKDEDGKPLNGWNIVLVDKNGQQKFNAPSNGSTGGLYSIRNVDPGIYEVKLVADNFFSERAKELKQQRFWGVAIKKGVRSVLNVVLKEGRGREFEEIGQPNVPTQKVMLITEEIEQLKALVAELKKQIEELKKK